MFGKIISIVHWVKKALQYGPVRVWYIGPLKIHESLLVQLVRLNCDKYILNFDIILASVPIH